MPENKFLKPADIAEICNQSLAWVSKNRRKLGGIKIGGRVFFPPEEVFSERLFCRKEGLEIRLHDEKSEIHSSLVRNKERGKRSGASKTNRVTRPSSTDMEFLTLVNLRLDEVKQRLSHEHYMDTVYHAKRWTRR